MQIKENIDLKPFTYFKIGGPARFFAEVTNEEDLKSAVAFAREKNIPFVVLGSLSNILVSDEGYNGLVIKMMMRGMKRDGTSLTADAGVPNALLVRRMLDEKLSGLEWAIGVPGSVGGSIRGNAGCFGGEFKDVLSSVRVFDARSGEISDKDNTFCRFGYRDSIFKHSPHLVVVSGTFALKEGDPEVSQKLVRSYTADRSGSQDIGASSAGCVFKNTPWPSNEKDKNRLLWIMPELTQFKDRKTVPVGFLVDHLGLKGREIGKIEISKKHGNYLINKGGATAEEVVIMISMIKEYIHRKFNLFLEEEIQYIGFE